MKYVLIPFAWLLRTLYTLCGNYGLALILFSLLTKVILLPFNAKSKKSMMKTSRLGPKLKELERQCGDDKLKYQQEMSNLYKKEGVSPTGGCLWSLLPLILLMALYYVIRQPMTYLMSLDASQIEAITALIKSKVEITGNTAYEQVFVASYIHQYIDEVRQIVPNIFDIDFSFLGVSLGDVPNWRVFFQGNITTAGVILFIFPCVSALSQWGSMMISQKLNGTVATNDKGEKDADAAAAAAQSMKTMMYVMPIFSLWIGFSMPASMCVYWIAQAVFNTAMDAALTVHYKKVYDAEDEIKRARAAEEAAIEAEKEARRAERRASQPAGANPNTSRRKLKQQQKALEPEITVKGKLSEEEREALRAERAEREKAKGGLSGDPNRPYSRGRAYDPNRYSRKVSPEAKTAEASEEANTASDSE